MENIRARLPSHLERRLFALIRSANDSTTDISMFNARAHGFLPKAPIRKEKVAQTLAGPWLKRFPLSQFPDSVDFDNQSESTSSSAEEFVCSSEDLAQKLDQIDALFVQSHAENWNMIIDQLHQLKGDLLTTDSGASIISILGMINLMLLSQPQDSDSIVGKWRSLKHKVHVTLVDPHSIEKASPAVSRWRRLSRSSKSLSSSLVTAASSATESKGLSSSFTSSISNVSLDDSLDSSNRSSKNLEAEASDEKTEEV